MINRISIYAIIAIMFITIPAFSWIRDANLINSSDSIGLGWIGGFYATGEKKIFEDVSIGAEYLKTNGPTYWQIAVNKQISGGRDQSYAFSFYGGIGYFDDRIYYTPTGPINNAYYPDLGFSYSWNINPYSSIRANILYFIPSYVEYAGKINNNTELAIGYGYPFQLLSIRYLL